MLNGVSDRLRARMVGAALGHQDPGIGEALVAAAREHGMLAMFEPLGGLMKAGASVRLRELLSAT
jgi:hypothetical protein